jgi:O-antigen/teichoic acid export membrane protein
MKSTSSPYHSVDPIGGTSQIASRAGTAVFWKGIQIGGVQGIAFVKLLVLARLLNPLDFGLFSVALITINTALTLTDVGMIPALVQKEQIEERHYHAAWSVGLTRSFAISAFLIVTAPYIAELFSEPRATRILQFLALRPLIDAVASIKIAEHFRNLRFRSPAIIFLSGAIVDAIVSILLAITWGVWAMVVGALAGSIIAVFVSYVMAPHRPKICMVRAVARPLIRFGQWIFISGVFTATGIMMLQMVVSRTLGVESLGLYFLSLKLAFMPLTATSKVVGDVAFPIYARLQNDGEQSTRAFQTIFSGMFAVLFPVHVLLIVLAPAFVEHILGPQWTGTDSIIRILAFAGIIQIFQEAVVPVLNGHGKPKKVAVLQGAESLLLVLSIWWMTKKYGLGGAAFVWLPAASITLILGAIFLKQTVPVRLRRLKGPVSAIAIASATGAGIAMISESTLPGLTGLVIAVILAIFSFGLVLWGFERRFRMGLADDFARAFPQLTSIFGIRSTQS